jgi:hypothetical protein
MRVTALAALGLILWLAAGAPAPARAQPGPRVVDFSPQGTVKQVRQARARFSDPMAALGDPRPADDVFEIACPEAGTPRWVDSREWVHDFGRDLPAGVRCTFRLRPGVTALDGRPVTADREFAFSTGGPAIRRAMPFEGSRWIDEAQAFVLFLDAAVTERSVLDHVHFAVDGVG